MIDPDESASGASPEIDARSEVVDRGPVQAWLAPTGRCNRFCAHCPIRVMGRLPDDTPDVDPAVLRRVESELAPGLRTLKLGGNNNGEPLLARNWDAILGALAGRALRPWLITNGILLDRERAGTLVDRGAILDVSLDAATEETFRSIRGKGFETVVANLETACGLRRARPERSAEVRITTTLCRRNLDELEAVVELAARLGVDRVQAGHLIPMSEEQRFESLFYHRAESNRVVERTRESAARLGIAVELPPPLEVAWAGTQGLEAERRPSHARKRCLHPWISTNVTERGWVTPCCASDQKLGDLTEKSFGEIWNGRRYRKLRRSVNSAHPPLYCQRCTLRGHRMTNTTSAEEEDFLSVIGPARRRDPSQFVRLLLLDRQARSPLWRLAYRGYLWGIGIRRRG